MTLSEEDAIDAAAGRSEMSNVNDGGPAFPVSEDNYPRGYGMTLRAYFAGQAMAGLLANDADGAWTNDDGTVCTTVKEISNIIARHSCTYADALIEELNR